EVEFLKVVALAAAVDDEEILGFSDRGQHAMPCAASVVHALARTGEEGLRRARSVRRIGADDDEEGPLLKRHEGLAAERMALDHGKRKRKIVGLAARNRYQDAGVVADHFGARQIVKALGLAA